MIGAVDEEQGALFRGQPLGARAVQVRQVTGGRLDHVGERDGPTAFRALNLHLRDPLRRLRLAQVNTLAGLRESADAHWRRRLHPA